MRLNRSWGSGIRDWGFGLAIASLVLLSVATSAAQYSFEEMAAGLKHPDPATRIRAIQILKESNYPEATAPIAATLEDPDDRVQLEAIDAERSLFMVRPVTRKRKVGFVIEVRSDAGAQVLAAGQLALLPRRVPREGHETSASIFKRQLTNSSAEMRRLAVEGLARGGRPEDLADLDARGRTERSNSVLLALHYAAIRLGAPSRPDPLVAALRDGSLRPLALQYLLELSPSIGSRLVDSLQSRDPDTRALVADVLGFSADPRVVQALEAATKDPDADAALAARRAIERITLATSEANRLRQGYGGPPKPPAKAEASPRVP